MMSTPPASAASANSARSPRSRRASVHRYRVADASRAGRSRGRCHTARVMWDVDTGVPGTGAESGHRSWHLPLPSHLIRVMPAKGGRSCRADHWPSSAAASSACRSRAAPRSTAGRCACTAARTGRLLGGRRHARPAQRRLAAVRSGCCGSVLPRWRCGAGGQGTSSTGCRQSVITARESLVVAVDRADVADLQTVGEWLAAQGHPVSFTHDRTRSRTASGPRHPARLPWPRPNWQWTTGPWSRRWSAHCERLGVQWAPPVDDLAAVTADVAGDRQRHRRARRCGPVCRFARSRARCCGCDGERAVCRCRRG